MVGEACAGFAKDSNQRLEVILAVPAAGPPGRHRGFRVLAGFTGGESGRVVFSGQAGLLAHLKQFDLPAGKHGARRMAGPLAWQVVGALK